jgi:hypothetical protein
MTDVSGGEVLVYEDPGGRMRVDVRRDRETVWLTQQQMVELFGRERSVITKHVRNVFAEGELVRDAVCANFAHTAAEGKTYQVEHYNLDVIISVGFRVKSLQGTRFRQWATKVLRDHLLRGYTLHARRLSEPQPGRGRAGACAPRPHAHVARARHGRGAGGAGGDTALQPVVAVAAGVRRRPPERAAAAGDRADGGTDTAAARAAADRPREELLARGEAGALFGQERGEALAAILAAIEQTFGGQSLYFRDRGSSPSDQAADARSLGRVAEGPAINVLCHAPCSNRHGRLHDRGFLGSRR